MSSDAEPKVSKEVEEALKSGVLEPYSEKGGEMNYIEKLIKLHLDNYMANNLVLMKKTIKKLAKDLQEAIDKGIKNGLKEPK